MATASGMDNDRHCWYTHRIHPEREIRSQREEDLMSNAEEQKKVADKIFSKVHDLLDMAAGVVAMADETIDKVGDAVEKIEADVRSKIKTEAPAPEAKPEAPQPASNGQVEAMRDELVRRLKAKGQNEDAKKWEQSNLQGIPVELLQFLIDIS